MIALSELIGKEKIAWRYDPVLLTGHYTIQKHLATFEHMAKRISGHIDRCIFSFVEMYKKLEQNMPELIPLTTDDMNELAKGLGYIAQKYHIPIQTCGTNGDYSQYSITASGCTTLEMIGKANHIKFRKLKHKGARQGCHCIESRDIGAYDTCLNGCKYCYANKKPDIASQNYKLHDKNSPLLLGNVKPTDTLQIGIQRSMKIKK